MKSNATSPGTQFLNWLVEKNHLEGLLAERVCRVECETEDRLTSVLLKLGLFSEDALAVELSRFTTMNRLNPATIPRLAVQIPDLNAGFIRARGLLPLSLTEDALEVACWDPLDEQAALALEYAARRAVRRCIGTRTEIEQAITLLYPTDRTDDADNRGAVAIEEDEIDRLKDLASDAPVIRLVQHLINSAISARASDIHIEPSEQALHVRFRLDGLLREIESPPRALGPSVVSRIKVMAGLDIAERRLPQDGRIRVTVHGKEIDFRVATTPTLQGESVVLRILDRQDVALDFNALGFDASLQQTLRDAVQRPFGILLVTGPTGSGKTTTLYAALKEINTPERKIITVEDPVEYVLQGVNQVPVRPQIGLTFAQALRAFLRQDPDVLMVGEIRDRETAEIAIQAALTGHLLLSTLHTNTAAGAITRLLDMGIDDYLLTSTMHLVVGQRLVRKLCADCKEPYSPNLQACRRFGIEDAGTSSWFRPQGCSKCGGTGFRGRTSILEVLPMSDSVRAQVLTRADAHTIERTAIAEGMRTMLQHGHSRVVAGITTAEEVLRVTSMA